MRSFLTVLGLFTLTTVGCVTTTDADEADNTASEVNSAAACNPLPVRASDNPGDLTGLTAMEGTPLPTLGPDAQGFFHPADGYTEGGRFATPLAKQEWHVDPSKIAAPAASGKLRVAEWNVERGNKLDEAIRLMKKKNVDVWLLNETDLYGRNSGGVVVAREIARALGYSYYTGIEFYERRDDRRGTSGNAIVSRFPLKQTRSIDLPILEQEGGHDWSEDQAEPRCGQRSALGAVVDAPAEGGATRELHLVAVHTENKSNKSVRLKQFDHAISDLVTPGVPTILAGDLNTVSPGEGGAMRDELKRRIDRDTRERAFFDCSRGNNDPTFSAALIVNLRIDWMLVQSGTGLTLDCPTNSYKVHSNEGSSDHKPVIVEMTVK